MAQQIEFSNVRFYIIITKSIRYLSIYSAPIYQRKSGLVELPVICYYFNSLSIYNNS
jgi:hypothetical protein